MQSSFVNLQQPPATEFDQSPVERELKVIFDTRLCLWRFEGSRAQLEAEDAIPSDIDWPDGTQSVSWEVDTLRYRLRRARPDDLKGPMKLWTSGDWWRLTCEPINRPNIFDQLLSEKWAALNEELYRQSPEGRMEFSARWCACLAARQDKAYQAFRALCIPERKKPGRPRKSASTVEDENP